MPANEIIRIDEREALMLTSNRLPVLLDTRRYYQRASLKRRAKLASAPLPQRQVGTPALVPLVKPATPTP